MTAYPANFKPLFTVAEIEGRIASLGKEITEAYKGKPLTVLSVLKGSFVFAADLCRSIDIPLNIDFIGLRSYGEDTKSSGVVEITLDVKFPLQGEHVLIVEDIVDTGLTLDYLQKNLSTRNPASIAIASFLYKPSRMRVPVKIDYLGFEVPDYFMVGYGLDHAGRYRNLPDIGYLDPPPL